MAIKPSVKTLTGTSVEILNVIRENATQNYKNYVPKATPNADSIKKIGAVIMDYPALQNEFVSALINRIGRVVVTSKMYDNPWSMFKKGVMEYGETVEEIFINIAKPFQYDPSVAENNVFKREIPDIRSAFHVLNYQKFYKATIQEKDLRKAFLSWNGVTDLIARIVDSMYTGANYDEFQTMKYMLATRILNGFMNPINIAPVSTANMKSIVGTIKGFSNNLTFLSGKNNLAGVKNATPKSEQYLIINSQFDATMDVEVLATAFNMDKAEFFGHRVLIDGFGDLDIERLNELFADDPTYEEIGTADLEALNTIPAVLVDEDFFMVLDNMNEFTENYNGEGLYWNYWYHCWKTFSVSPFSNNAVFLEAIPTVTSVTVSPKTATASAGQNVQLNATVQTENFASQGVVWSITSGEGATISTSGLLSLTAEATGEITITATSVFDPTKSDTATITVA